MTVNTHAPVTPGASLQAPKRRFRWSFLPPWLLVLSLIASNVATILSDQAHEMAFGLTERVASLAGETVASALLSRSTTRVRCADAERAARALRVERDAIRADRDLALSRHRALEIENETVKRAAAAAKAERDAVKALAAKRAATVQKIARSATTKLAARSAESVTSLPLRAAPYVGIAVLLTTTGLELQADCDVAQSLASLNAEHANEPIDVGPICRRVNAIPTREQLWRDVKAKARHRSGSSTRRSRPHSRVRKHRIPYSLPLRRRRPSSFTAQRHRASKTCASRLIRAATAACQPAERTLNLMD